MIQSQAPRPIRQIAQDILQTWPKVSPWAKPYLGAMLTLDHISDRYYADSARSVLLYFLANAQSFRGTAARSLKAELKAHLAEPSQ